MVDNRYIRPPYDTVGSSQPVPKRLTPRESNGYEVRNTGYHPYVPHTPEEYEVYGGRRVQVGIQSEESYGQPNASPTLGHRLPRQSIPDDDRHGYIRHRHVSPSPRRQGPRHGDNTPLRKDPPNRREQLVTEQDGKFLVKYLVRPSGDYQPMRIEPTKPTEQGRMQQVQVSPKRSPQQKVTKISISPQRLKDNRETGKITAGDLRRRMNKDNVGQDNAKEGKKRVIERKLGKKKRRHRSKELERGRRGNRINDESKDEHLAGYKHIEPRERYRESPERRSKSRSREIFMDGENVDKSRDSSNMVLDRVDRYNHSSDAPRKRDRYVERERSYDEYVPRRRSYSRTRSRGRMAYYPRRRQSTPYECIEVGLDDKPWFEHVNDAVQESCPALNCDSQDSDSDSVRYRQRAGRQRYNEKTRVVKRSDCCDQVVIPPWMICFGGIICASFFL